MPPDEKVDVAGLKRRSARGGVVTLVSQGLTIAIQLTSTIVLARLLLPADYGIVAMVAAVTNFANVFRDLGLSSVAIQRKNLTCDQQTNLFWLNVAMGGVLTLLVSAASPLVVWFYSKPELLWVTVAMSLNFLIGSLGSQHGASLVRNMQFGRNAVPPVVGAIVGLSVSVLLAINGWSYWALVWGNLCGAFVITLCLSILSPFRPSWMRRNAGTRDMVKFGANVTAFDFINYFHRNFDNVLIGKFVGADALGLYSRAYALLMLPIGNLRGPITTVGFPALSQLQDQPQAFRDYYRKITALLAMVSMPLTAFLFVSVDEVIAVALGSNWSGAAPIFAVLALVAFVQPVITLWGVVALSRGMARRYLHLGVFNTVCCVLGFVVGLPWGAIGVATGYAAATYATAVPVLVWAFRGTPLRLRDFFASTLRPCVASVVAGGVCFVAINSSHSFSNMVQLSLGGSVFVLIYCASFLLLPGGRGDLVLLGGIAKSVFGRRAAQ